MTRMGKVAARNHFTAALVRCGLMMVISLLAAKAAAAGMDESSLGYRFGTSLAQVKSMPLPFDGLPKGATVKCGDDPDLRSRMVGYVARDEARYESVGIMTCRVVAPDPANLAWWRPVEFEINGVKARLRFDFMEVAGSAAQDTELMEASLDDTGFSDALYGGNDLGGPAVSEYALVAAKLTPVHAKDSYKLLAGLNQRLGGSKVVKDQVEIAPGISFNMPVPTWQRGNMTVAAWDPTELGHYDLVFTMTSAKERLQTRLNKIE